MPNLCKIAVVTPIHKSGDPTDPGNYRPISILPILGKAIEFFVNNQLTQYLTHMSKPVWLSQRSFHNLPHARSV